MIYDSQAFPDAKERALKVTPGATCKKQWSTGKYIIALPSGEIFKTGNGSPSGAWVDYAMWLGLYSGEPD